MTMAVVAVAGLATLALLPGGAPLGAPRAALLRCAAPLCCDAAATEIAPPKMESSVGFDFVPLLTALQAGEFREADGLTRAGLITLAGDAAVKRGYVYFTEVPKLPVEDLATIERLWQTYSGGKFGYSVQRAAFESKKVNGNFEDLFARIGWKNKEGSLLRWLPEAKSDEFIYDAEKAPKGHLPLTSTLRGTQLLQGLLTHEAWSTEGARHARTCRIRACIHARARGCALRLTPPFARAWQSSPTSNSEAVVREMHAREGRATEVRVREGVCVCACPWWWRESSARVPLRGVPTRARRERSQRERED